MTLLCDLVALEKLGVYIEHLGTSAKGTFLFVSADNLGAHSLAGFYESFSVDKFCRFCMASKDCLRRYGVVHFTSETKIHTLGMYMGLCMIQFLEKLLVSKKHVHLQKIWSISLL